METRRIILYAVLTFILYTMWNTWNAEHSPAIQQNAAGHLLPAGLDATQSNTTSATSISQTMASLEPVLVQTKLVSVDINPVTANIQNLKLTQFPVSVEDKNKVIELLNSNQNEHYLANTTLMLNENGNWSAPVLNWKLLSKDIAKTEQKVIFEANIDSQLSVQKTFVFDDKSYPIQIAYTLKNNSDKVIDAFINAEISRENPKESSAGLFQIGTFVGSSYSNPEGTHYQKLTFKDMNKANLNAPVKGGWVAMQEHYFLTAFVPPADNTSRFFTKAQNNQYVIGLVSPKLSVAAGQTTTQQITLYAGPEDTETLAALSPSLDLTVDYGWLWFLSSLLFKLMKAIHSVVGNWGWSIILVTVLIKLAFYNLSASSYRSMANMRNLQPKLAALKERFGDDKAKLSQATMELYRQEKVNPLGGCLPIVIQIPVFIALYWVLIESVELRQAPFIGWIQDLSASDPYHVLPVIMGLTMLVQQRLNPTPPDPMQARMMMLLPVLFTGLFWSFPAGLVLYWIVNNTLSIAQQWFITRSLSKPIKAKVKNA